MLPFMGACEFLTGVNEPDEIDITIESDDVSQAVLVTSTFFIQVPDPECPDECERLVEFVDTDTTTVSLPYHDVRPFTERQQYFVETWPVGGQAATVSMMISIDGRLWYDDFRRLLPEDVDGEQETLRFVYQFRELIL
jgi:hypothetical protein